MLPRRSQVLGEPVGRCARSALELIKPGDSCVMQIERDGTLMYLTLEFE